MYAIKVTGSKAATSHPAGPLGHCGTDVRPSRTSHLLHQQANVLPQLPGAILGHDAVGLGLQVHPAHSSGLQSLAGCLAGCCPVDSCMTLRVEVLPSQRDMTPSALASRSTLLRVKGVQSVCCQAAQSPCCFPSLPLLCHACHIRQTGRQHCSCPSACKMSSAALLLSRPTRKPSAQCCAGPS